MDPAYRQRIVPPVYLLGVLILMSLLHNYLPLYQLFGKPFAYIGLPLIVLGLLCAIGGAGAFKKAGTAVKPFQPASKLVTGGLYRLSRNPMYVGMLLIVAGVCVCLGSIGAVLPLPLFFYIIQEWFVKKEELLLEQSFGEEYRAFKHRVRRWL